MSSKLSRRSFLKLSLLSGTGVLIGCKSSTNSKVSASAQFDTIVKNGLVYDGNGGTPIKADLGIKGNKITAIGDLGDSAYHLVDAEGMAVSPGFIDIHTHTDTKLLVCPQADSRIYQGITTDVGGNCGGSPFPMSFESQEARKITGESGNGFATLDEFFSALEKSKHSINFATLTGQGDIRAAIVGNNDVQPTPDQLKKMRALLQQTLEQGSYGMSTGLEYAPGSYALEQELTELCRVVAAHNGLYATHMRNEDDRVEQAVAEAISTAHKSGVNLQISHLKAQNQANWHKAPALLKQLEAAAASGINVMCDRYPYVAFSTGLSTFIPLWARQGDKSEVLERLKDKDTSKKIAEYAESRIKRLGGGKNVVITSCKEPGNRQYVGVNLEECAAMANKSLTQFVIDMLIEENVSVDMIGFAMSEDNVKMILSHPLAMPASDGSVSSPVGPLSVNMPHPRSYGTFPRFFGKYTRDEGIMELAAAIKKATSVPASRLGLTQRGQLQLGYFADIVVFNPATIIDKADFTNPHQFPVGINHVLVNGTWTIKDGQHTGELAGSVLRRA